MNIYADTTILIRFPAKFGTELVIMDKNIVQYSGWVTFKNSGEIPELRHPYPFLQSLQMPTKVHTQYCTQNCCRLHCLSK